MQINWREIPLVRILIPYSLGIILHAHLPEISTWVILGCVLSISILAFRPLAYKWRWVSGIIIGALLVLWGAWRMQDAQSKMESRAQQLQRASAVYGHVLNIRPSEAHTRLLLRIQHVRIGEQAWITLQQRAWVYAKHRTSGASPQVGDALMITADFHPVQGTTNPHAFDYAQFLYYQGMKVQSYADTLSWELVNSEQNAPFAVQIQSLRTHLLSVIEQYIPGLHERAVAKALILGYKDDLVAETRDAYAQTGAMHVLAVSGLHVGLIYLILHFLLKRLRRCSRYGKWLHMGCMLVGIWAFALVTGAAPSVMRAATMFSFLIVGLSLERYSNVYNTLTASAFFLLVYNPFLIGQLGFQLSYLAVLGIVYFQPKLYRCWIIDNRIGDYLWQLLSVSLAAQIATLPLTVYYFHQFPLYFWLSGWIVVPAAAVILSLGLLLLIVSFLAAPLAMAVGWLLQQVLWIVNSLIFLIQQLPYGLLSGIWLSPWQLVMLFIILACVIAGLESRQKKWFYAAFFIAMVWTASFSLMIFKRMQSKEIVLYHVRPHTLIDLWSGNGRFCLYSQDIDSRKEKYAAQNYRGFRSQSLRTRALLSSESHLQGAGIRFDKGFLQIGQQLLYILLPDSPIAHLPASVDALIVCQNPKIDPHTFFQAYQADAIIIDASNYRKTWEKWSQYADQHDIPCHQVYEQGYWKMRFH